MQLIKDASENKLRGGYYTPSLLANFILNWALGDEGKKKQVLEPSCGDGAFLKELKKDSNLKFKKLVAVEYDAVEASKARKIGLKNTTVRHDDFHKYCFSTKDRFDVIVGNPPYIRYQYYKKGEKDFAEKIFQKSSLQYSKLTNAWVTFVVGACQLLNETGRLGFVVPAELLQVSYSRQVRNFLAHFFNKIYIVSFQKLVFEDAEQEVVLLLCEKDASKSHFIGHIQVLDAQSLTALDANNLEESLKPVDFKCDKWTYYFLSSQEIALLKRLNKLPKISDYASVEVGITTGANSYFSVTKETVDKYKLQDYAFPMVGRSVQVNCAVFDTEDWRKNVNKGTRANLLIFPETIGKKCSSKVKEYLKKGVQDGVDKGYKTSIRDDWYVIPSIKLSDALFLRRNHLCPKLVLNKANAYTTDTMHRVFIKENVNKSAFIASYYNSLSFASAEIVGRSFGGGVLELMPSEVESIILPFNDSYESLLNDIDTIIRDPQKNIDDVLSLTDEIILGKGLGLTQREISIINGIWKKLSGRRLNRARSSKKTGKQ